MLTNRAITSSASGRLVFVGAKTHTMAGTTSNVTVSLTNLTGGSNSAPQAGDLVIVYFGTGSDFNRDLTISGYTELIELFGLDAGIKTNMVVAYKFMTATPDTSFTITGGTQNSSDAGAVAVHVWRNAATPTLAGTTEESDTLRPTPADATPTVSGSVVLIGAAGGYADVTQLYGSNDLLLGFVSAGSQDSYDSVVGLGYLEWTSGTIDPRRFFLSPGVAAESSCSCASATVIVRPT